MSAVVCFLSFLFFFDLYCPTPRQMLFSCFSVLCAKLSRFVLFTYYYYHYHRHYVLGTKHPHMYVLLFLAIV